VSYIIGGLAAVGIAVPDDVRTWITGAIGTLIAALYYVVVRWLEQRVPWVSVLLGSTKQPMAYAKPSADGKAHVITTAPDPVVSSTTQPAEQSQPTES
jgi:hypothetical protein